MLKLFQSLISLFFNQINKDIKIHGLIILVKLLKRIRIFFIFLTLIIVSAIMSALTLFVSIANIIKQQSTSAHVSFDGLLIFSSTVFIFSLLSFLFLIHESSWFKILEIDQIIKNIHC